MEGEKRSSNRSDEGEMDRKRRKGGDVEAGEQSVTEDEMEQFFAILRRIQVSLKYFQENRCDRRKLMENMWRPRFQAEDFNQDNRVDVDGGKKDHEDKLVGDSGLDLNSDPASCNNTAV